MTFLWLTTVTLLLLKAKTSAFPYTAVLESSIPPTTDVTAAQYVSNNDIITATTTLPMTSTTSQCAIFTCGPCCTIITGPNGCPACNCSTPSYLLCSGHACPEGQECKLDFSEDRCYPRVYCSGQTETPSTPGFPPTPCPLDMCGRRCCSIEVHSDGCFCSCIIVEGICLYNPCRDGEDCVIEFKDDPCSPEMKCYPSSISTNPPTTPSTMSPSTMSCPVVTCGNCCSYITGPDGCSACNCSTPPNPCQDALCPDGQECQVIFGENQCYPESICSPINATTTPSPITTTSSCGAQLLCHTSVGCVSYLGTDACPRCACPDPTCQDLVCHVNEECVLIEGLCSTTPCVPEATCVPRTTSTTSPTHTASECPFVTCELCCEFITGPDGCQACDCYTPDPCLDNVCPEGQDCVMDNNACYPQPYCAPSKSTSIPSTYPTPTTSSGCPNVTCGYCCDYINGSDGCPACNCSTPPNPCLDVLCPDGQECEVIFEDYQCYPEPFCSPINATTPCPSIECLPGCKLDFRGGGCPTCACPPTCKDITCDICEKCVLQKMDCLSDPCFPQPVCVKNEI